MNKKLISFFLNITLIIALTGLCVGILPRYGNNAAALSPALAKFASPDSIVNNVKSKISAYNSSYPEQTTITVSRKSTEVMQRAGSKDSDDGSDLKTTPPDIAKLMKTARKKIKKSDAVGKTSEEPYVGGGKITEYGGVEIQSKIPAKFYKPDIKALLKKGSDLSIPDKSKPSVLVYHSHTTESYALLDNGYYIKSDARSKNTARNVVRVGDELVKYLEKAGFNVIHDREIHDLDYNSSYDESRKSVEKYLEKYPSIEVTIDLHRDSITYKNKTKVKPTVEINGKKAARMMLIAGCEYGKVRNFPDWEYNLRFDLQVQKCVNGKYNGLMRPILFSQRRYNMFETHNSFLLEVGTDANTLDEACYSARLFANAFGELLNEKYAES